MSTVKVIVECPNRNFFRLMKLYSKGLFNKCVQNFLLKPYSVDVQHYQCDLRFYRENNTKQQDHVWNIRMHAMRGEAELFFGMSQSDWKLLKNTEDGLA
ncbi:CLUMA_CG012518, isoform A [Clunio marinus]|uniref:CLUMA_CG012518, isoform A n=1 Tax=Clunio marinus TaxID=568069 RepID=A0A1J1IL13_9DIPT|nr:CLUMA_CG012518, isoform A [Clunio marinus]